MLFTDDDDDAQGWATREHTQKPQWVLLGKPTWKIHPKHNPILVSCSTNNDILLWLGKLLNFFKVANFLYLFHVYSIVSSSSHYNSWKPMTTPKPMEFCLCLKNRV